ncbi:MAG: nicotinate-nucleotide--dimethylbenzimidazole phosphoribosyltransferase [Rhodobacteraceae bacterium]|jgi:nicotinate-nucleotide--dimethylbenzimidazole phosphoribosyltransferase|nr:nicotinate-nucleotide--dimethylbenzimidazole phosphoribosyltransferase [Paracoccaceae bacterium]
MPRNFATLEDFADICQGLPEPCAQTIEAARSRNGDLTKPPGALGRLEALAIWYCGWRGQVRARINTPQIIVFAGNHGVTAQGVSAFPPDVTAQMVMNFQAGGAAINQLASSVGASLSVVPIALETPTADFTLGPAMTPTEFIEALNIGWQAVDDQADLLVLGEMGIGNTTCAAAIALALFGGTAQAWTGAGTGVIGPALEAKIAVVAAGVERHRAVTDDGLEILRCLGGREIAAMAGAMIRARTLSIPLILDGFICSAAAACLQAVHAGALDHAVAGHVSAEAAHAPLLEKMGKTPILSLNMRLGEGSGAAVAVPVLKAALACHSGMATFAEAGVADT